jgi:hypothetical protein
VSPSHSFDPKTDGLLQDHALQPSDFQADKRAVGLSQHSGFYETAGCVKGWCF